MLKLDQRSIVAGLAFAVLGIAQSPAGAQDTVSVVSHRHPALEYYTAKMQEIGGAEGVEVDARLMPIDKAFELATITLSAGDDAIDILYVNDTALKRFADKGWLLPLNDLWEQYRDEYSFDDFPESVMQSLSLDGDIYAVPFLSNTMMFFYRRDLFEEAGVEPPETIERYAELAEQFNSPRMAGTITSLKPVDAALNEAHWYMNAIGDGWFDDEYKPIFNNENGVRAIEMMKRIAQYAPPGFTAHANDESTINLQQGLAAMGIQWFTRAASMEDPEKSRVVGEIDWVAPPEGGQRMANDGYAISKFSSADPEKLFKILATASDPENMRVAAQWVLPPRRSLLTDKDLQAKYRWYPAALNSLEVGQAFPALPEFLEVGEIITRRIQQAVTGEMEVQAALDLAAGETEEFLAERGYY